MNYGLCNMKKILFIIFVFGLFFNTGAQIKIGGSKNLNSVRYCETTQLTFNQALNLIVFTHRVDFSKSLGSGTYEASFSTDFGATWDSALTIFNNQATRYPNGVVLNFANNRNYDTAIWAVCGPFTNGTSSAPYDGWDSAAFGSIFFSGSDTSQSFLGNSMPGVINEDEARISYMSSSNDSTVHSIGDGFTYNSGTTKGTTYTGASLNTGKWNTVTNSLNCTQTKFQPHFQSFPPDTLPEDTNAEMLTPSGTAWSLDGKTGYVVLWGNLDSSGYDFHSEQPIVYVTTNSGNSWNMEPLHDFINDSIMSPYLYPTSSYDHPYLPYWDIVSYEQEGEDAYDLAVDSLNTLHIIGAVRSASSTSPDSVGYTYSYYPRSRRTIFDVTYSPNGYSSTRYIDTIHALPWDSANGVVNNWFLVAFSARVQVSSNPNRSKIFAVWEDDVSSGTPWLEKPDIFGEGYDIRTKKSTYKQLTNTGTNYFLMVSDNAKEGNGADSIPCVVVQEPSASNNSGLPIEYLYLNNVSFNEYLGIQPLTNNTFTVSPNYPNPFNKSTEFTIQLQNESVVSIDVFNMVGQKIWSRQPQKMNPGSQVITLNGTSLESGVYFCRVTISNQSVTLKMVVAK